MILYIVTVQLFSANFSFSSFVVTGTVCSQCLPDVWSELDDLREFYDPDTVELMNWIKLARCSFI